MRNGQTISKRTDGNPRTVQASWLAFANLVTLSATLVISAILSRAMTPTEYGTYRQVMYVYTTLLIVFSLGLPKAYAYFLAQVPIDEGKDVVRKLHLLFFGLSVLFSIALFMGARPIADGLGNPLLFDHLRHFAVVPMLLMPVIGVENILTVYGKPQLVFVYVIIGRTFSIVCTVLPVVVFDAGVSGAVVGFAAASTITCIVGLRLSFLPFKSTVSKQTRLSVAKIFRFAIPVFISSIYGFIIASASPFFVSRYLGVEDFALFANGYRELPLAGMVIGATANVLLPEFSRMSSAGADRRQYIGLWKSVILKSSSVIYPFSVFCCIFAPEIIGTLYGDNYREAAGLFRIITLVNLTRVVPYAPLLFASGKGRQFADAHLATAILIVGLELWCVNRFPSLTAIAAIATGCTLFCLVILMIAISRLLETGIAKLMPWGTMSKILFISTATGLTTKAVVLLTDATHDLTVLSSGFALYMLLYIFIAFLAGIDYVKLFDPVIPETTVGRIVRSVARRLRALNPRRNVSEYSEELIGKPKDDSDYFL